MIRILFILTLLAAPAHAHNIITSAFPSGTSIEGEVGFSDGTMATDLLIEVFGDAGEKLGETTTDADGFFLFTPNQPVAHIFRGDLGAGHIAEIKMSAKEVAEIMGQTAAQDTPSASTFASNGSTKLLPTTALSPEARDEIAKMLRDELRPLRQELTAYRHKNDLQTVLGGLGYIFGLFGLGFYIAARRKLGGDK